MAKLTLFQHFYLAYARFHNNKVNKLIHILCIPILEFTIMAFFTHRFMLFSFQIKDFTIDIDITLASIIIVGLLYIYMDRISGMISCTILVSAYSLQKQLVVVEANPVFGIQYMTLMVILHVI